MKHAPQARQLRRQALLSLYINERLEQLERHPDPEAQDFYREVQWALAQAGICWAESQPAMLTQSAVTIVAEEPAPVSAPAPAAAEQPATDYAALIEAAEGAQR